jgi:tRNA pseudouridine55 synthase
MTSHDCVDAMRRILPRKFKVGHGGTLDPFCTGLLILLLGKATRLAGLFQKMDKTYEGIFRFGAATDSFDRDGKVTETGPPPELDAAGWTQAASRFVGPQMQLPPNFSAKRVGSRRAYELAREGEVFELQPVPVEVYAMTVEPVSPTDVLFRLKCSSGTYVRAIARDLGAALSSPAHCFQLCRTAVGPFSVQEANPLEDPLAARGFVPFDKVEADLPMHSVSPREERLLLNGQDIPAPPPLYGQGRLVKVVGPDGRFLALGKVAGRQIHPQVVFPV